jgi:hypothetical protein
MVKRFSYRCVEAFAVPQGLKPRRILSHLRHD